MSDDIQEQMEQLNHQAVQLFKHGSYEEAISTATRVFELAREHLGEMHPAFTISLNNLGALYASVGNYSRAERLLWQVLAVRRASLGDYHPDVTTSLNNLVGLYFQMGHYAQAEQLMQYVLEIDKKILGTEHPDFATDLNNLAALYQVLGKYIQAEPLYQQALEIRRATLGEAHPDFASALNNLASLYEARYDHIQAEPLYQRALDIQRTAVGEAHPDFASSLNNLAALYEAVGNYDKAESLYSQVLEIRRAALGEAHPDFASSLNNLAGLHEARGNYAQAESLYRQALTIRRMALGEEHPHVADSLNNLATLYHAIGDYTQAMLLLQEAHEIWRKKLGDMHPYVAKSLNNLALSCRSLGIYIQAESLYQRALDIQRATLGEAHPDFAFSLNNLADLYEAWGNYNKAEPLYQQALEIRRATLGEAHPDFASSLNNLAALYKARGNYAQAEVFLKEVLEVQQAVLGKAHPNKAASMNNLAMLYIATNRGDEALTLMKQASTVDQQMIGQVFSIGSESQRMAYLRLLQWSYSAFLSLIVLHISHSSTATQAGFDLVLQRKAIGAEALAIQRDAVLSGRYPDLAFMLQKLTSLRAQIARKTLAGPESEGLEAHHRFLVEWNAQREQLEADLAHRIPEMSLMHKLQTANRQAVIEVLPQGAALVEFVRFDAFNFHAIPARGQRQWKEAHYVVFVVVAGEPENVRMIDLGEADLIDQHIATFRMAITGEAEANGPRQNELNEANPSQGEKRADGRHLKAGLIQLSREKYRSEGAALRRKIFDPLEAVLGSRKRLFLATDGDLNRLPFEVLPTDNGHYLIDTYRISYLSTGRDVLRFWTPLSGQPTSSLIVADPDFDLSTTNESALPGAWHPGGRRSRELERGSLHFERLSGTRNEGEQIARMLGVQPLLGEVALESQLKVHHSPRILHIATHGFFLPDQQWDLNKEVVTPGVLVTPNSASGGRLHRFFEQHAENPLLRSGLALAGANTWNRGGLLPLEAEDGILTAEDVSSLDLLNTELVVLSACETGLGKVHIGEGVFGLRRAFVLAGAKTLVMSLWKVPDQQTQELMVDFYQRILEGQPRADALREAQLALKAKYPHPYYWGAFICQGDPRPLAL
ncbi:MAG: tetratricopeptide repeat protein [Ktedonobacteraceae bacterium]